MKVVRWTDPSLTTVARTLLKVWPWLVGGVVVGLGFAWAASSVEPPNYEATAVVTVADSAAIEAIGGGIGAVDLEEFFANEAVFARSDQVVEVVMSNLGVARRTDLVRTSVAPQIDADALDFITRSTEPEEAALVATAWAEGYAASLGSRLGATFNPRLRSLRDRRDELGAQRLELADQLTEARISGDTAAAGQLETDLELVLSQIEATSTALGDLEEQRDEAALIPVVEPATTPQAPAGVSLGRGLFSAGLAGGLIGATVGLWRASSGRRKPASEVLEHVGVRFYGTMSESESGGDERSPAASDAAIGLQLVNAVGSEPSLAVMGIGTPVASAARRLARSLASSVGRVTLVEVHKDGTTNASRIGVDDRGHLLGSEAGPESAGGESANSATDGIEAKQQAPSVVGNLVQVLADSAAESQIALVTGPGVLEAPEAMDIVQTVGPTVLVLQPADDASRAIDGLADVEDHGGRCLGAVVLENDAVTADPQPQPDSNDNGHRE